jgi:hypothetical protein
MNTFPERPAPVNPAPDDWPDDLVELVDDPTEDVELWVGYERWRRDCAFEDAATAVLLAWARETLSGPMLPCQCDDGNVCLRCRVTAIVGKP